MKIKFFPIFFTLLFFLGFSETDGINPCSLQINPKELLDFFKEDSSFKSREKLWENLLDYGSYEGSSEQNYRLSRSILGNVEYLNFKKPESIVSFLDFLNIESNFSNRSKLYSLYVHKRDLYTGKENQNKELLNRILEAMVEIKPLKKNVKVESYKKGVQLPDDNSLLETLWKRNFQGERWDKGNEVQKKRLKEMFSERLISEDFDFTKLKDIMSYLGFKYTRANKSLLWDEVKRYYLLYKNKSYTGTKKDDKNLINFLNEKYLIVGEKPSIFFEILMTAYNPLPEQTDSTPFEAASGKMVKEGYAAVSKDLEDRFPLGSFVEVVVVCEIDSKGNCLNSDSPEIGDLFRLKIEDRMNARKRNQIDIFFMCKQDAINFGRRKALLLSK